MKKIFTYIAAVVMLACGGSAAASMTSFAEPITAGVADASCMTVPDMEILYNPVLLAQKRASGNAAADTALSAANSEDADVESAEKAAAAEFAAAETEMKNRQLLVNYALQFVGKPYRYGGTDPHTGADCSGFVRYVMAHGAGIGMNRSSREQATQGTQISAAHMQPGDLLFYSNGSRIDHVAIYIGDGQIVHASSKKTGIKTSVWNYRTPVRIVSMFG